MTVSSTPLEILKVFVIWNITSFFFAELGYANSLIARRGRDGGGSKRGRLRHVWSIRGTLQKPLCWLYTRVTAFTLRCKWMKEGVRVDTTVRFVVLKLCHCRRRTRHRRIVVKQPPCSPTRAATISSLRSYAHCSQTVLLWRCQALHRYYCCRQRL